MQPKIQNVTVECLSCHGSSHIRIVNDHDVLYVDHSPIIACRLRGDMKWGFECQCGNDSRLAREEKNDAKILVKGGEHALKRLVKSLKIPDEDKFAMVYA